MSEPKPYFDRVLWRITAPHFCAGIELGDWTLTVKRCAPILRYMQGWEGRTVLAYCEKKNWKLEIVTPIQNASQSSGKPLFLRQSRQVEQSSVFRLRRPINER